MTKIKNTKKGMAKKTLSMSLVVAMLATSNVPVWAAEFSDGSDASVATEADAFTADETEVPVVEDTSDVDTATADAITASDLDVSGLTFTLDGGSKLDGKAVFGNKLTVGGKIVKKSDNTPLQNYSFGYRIKGHTDALLTGTVNNNSVASMSQNLYGNTWTPAIGQTIELYIFRDDAAAKIDNLVLASFTLEKKEVTGAIELQLDGQNANQGTFKQTTDGYTIAYTGKIYSFSKDSTDENSISISGISRTDGTGNTPIDYDKYDVAVSNSVQNAGDVMTIRVTPKANSGLSGEFTTKVTVVKRQGDKKAESFLNAELKENLEYEYTGNPIAIPTDKLTVKEQKGYADATLPQDVIKSASIPATDANGTPKVTVGLNADKVNNFDISTKNTLETDNTTGYQVTIKKRDLSKVNVSLAFNKKALDCVPQGLAVKDFWKYLAFATADGTALTLKSTDYTIEVKDGNTVMKANDTFKQGTYTATVAATTNGNCVNSVDFTFIVGSAVSSAKSDNLTNTQYFYTGSEIKPDKTILGDVDVYGKVAGRPDVEKVATIKPAAYEIVGYKNNVDANAAQKGTVPTVTIKVTGGSDYVGRTFDIPFTIQQLTVSKDTVTVPKTVSYEKDYTKAEEYKVQLAVTAKDTDKKTIVKALTANDYTVKYEYKAGQKNADGSYTATANNGKNDLHNFIQSTIVITNKNFRTQDTVSGTAVYGTELTLADKTEIVAKALTDSMVKVNPSSYTYTGAAIVPNYYVIDGVTVLYNQADYGTKGEYKYVRCDNNLNVGTAKVVVAGINDKYSGTASASFEITPANTNDVKVTIDNQTYTGKQVRPRTFKVTLNGNDVTNQFEIVGYGENVSGKGTVELKPTSKTKNFTGANITAEFNIVKEVVTAQLDIYNKNGVNVTNNYKVTNTTGNYAGSSFDFDGTEKTFAATTIKDIKKVDSNDGGLVATKATANDLEVKYYENIAGEKSGLKDNKGNYYNIAYVYLVAKDGSGYTGNKTLPGTKITGVVDYITFAIKNVAFVDKNVTVTNGVYAGGLQVRPQVLVQINGNTLVEGKDYELVVEGEVDGNHYTDATAAKPFKVTVKGKGGYTGSLSSKFDWGIDKKDIKDCDVKVTDGIVTVMNGYVPVPTTEYTSKNNGDGTYTVTANSASKNYTGSKTVKADGKAADEKPDAPMISSVKVVGNKATAILSGDSDGAAGYDYVISTDRDCITNKDYDSVNKNQVQTSTTFKYVQQGTYYAYCHAWKRDANGKKVFSDWSNAYPFVVSAITPDAPVITNVKVSGSTIKVTYKAAANATGYDVVLGTASKKENGETRPYHYGDHKVLNLKEGTVTATFKNVPKGTWVVGMHAFNRTSEDGTKVFSPWSNLKKATVK